MSQRNQQVLNLKKAHTACVTELQEQKQKHDSAMAIQKELMAAEQRKIDTIKRECDDKLKRNAETDKKELLALQQQVLTLKSNLQDKELEIHQVRQAAIAGKGEVEKEALASFEKEKKNGRTYENNSKQVWQALINYARSKLKE